MMLVVCKPLGTKLTRSACGDRFVASNQQGSRPLGNPRIACGSCRGCEVGRAHANGDRPEHWPDGSPIVEIRLTAAGSPAMTPAKRWKAPKPIAPEVAKPTPVAAPIEPPATPTPGPRGQLSIGLPGLAHDAEKGDAGRGRGKTAATPARAVSGLLWGGLAVGVEGALDTDPNLSEPSHMVRRAGKAPRWIDANGVRDSIAGWARRLGVAHTVIAERLRRGWPEALAVTLPKGATMGAKVSRSTPDPIPLSSYELARALDVLRREGFEVERIGLSPRGDVLVIRPEERHAENAS